jgi:hypothetical protein
MNRHYACEEFGAPFCQCQDKTADEGQPSMCDFCQTPAIIWAHDDSNGDEKLLCKKHLKLYKDWRLEII